MGEHSKIEWTDATWNPLVAFDKTTGKRGWFCTHASEGCRNCYAEKINVRLGNGLAYIAQNLPKIEWRLVNLDEPLRWRKPRRIFVNSMTDLFHEDVPDELIDQVFAVMALCPQHVFQVLTKRAARMRAYFSEELERAVAIKTEASKVSGYERLCEAADFMPWPYRNIHLGVSCEDQQTADERILLLRQTPAAIHFLSLEPLLEDLGELNLDGVDWVIVGGESGPHARPMDLAWARSVVKQCADAGTACFVKQLGSKPHSVADHISHRGDTLPRPDGFCRFLNDRKGGDLEEWPSDLRVRQFPSNP